MEAELSKRMKLLLVIGLWLGATAAQTASAQGPQQGSAAPSLQAGAQGSSPAVSMLMSNQSQSPLEGSVPDAKPTPGVLQLTIKDALDRGLKHNLGLLLDSEATRVERGRRWNALSELLPHVSAHVSETTQQVNLKALGIPSFPGLPSVVGPFSVFDARANLSQSVFNFGSLENLKAAAKNVQAAQYTAKDARDLVLLVVGNAYLLANADAARVEAAEAEMNTAAALHDKAQDMLKAGLTPSIDELRAKVELQTRQQQLIVARNDFAKQKLNLARAIGLAEGQEFTLAEKTPYAPFEPPSLENELGRAFASRSDYQSALAQLRAAELARKAAAAERYPSLGLNADYGDIGLEPGNSHGTFSVAGTLSLPLFQGGRIKGDIIEADALLKQRRAEVADLHARIDYEVRTARLDLKAASDQVGVAKSQLDLAQQTLAQAQDRFGAGVVDNLEVVQAQDNVAAANDAYISSLYAHNVSKVQLARAVGVAEQAVMQYLGGK
ncbi:MAG TPA: TolC family protein [Terriglobia bacterium]|nr:TolC family protein [Terriglobia bacterium]